MEKTLDDKVYQVLEKKMPGLEYRIKDTQARKVEDEVFDHPTLLAIYKLICDKKLGRIDFPVSTGKEGNVFKGTAKDGSDVAVKIYRISNLSFKTIARYILGDHRFKGISNNRRKLMYQWTQKEFRNLSKMREAGMAVPEPIAYENNVLVMEYVAGKDGPAPMLRDLPPDDPEAAVDWLLGQVGICWKKAGLVHGDISEYNVLAGSSGLVIIDVSQGVPVRHPMADELLRRDIHNITHYFGKLGAKRDPDEAYNAIIKGGINGGKKSE